MPCIVVVECGCEIRTAYVSERDANGDARTHAVANIIAGREVETYLLATGPLPYGRLRPTLWQFPLDPLLDIHSEMGRLQEPA